MFHKALVNVIQSVLCTIVIHFLFPLQLVMEYCLGSASDLIEGK